MLLIVLQIFGMEQIPPFGTKKQYGVIIFYFYFYFKIFRVMDNIRKIIRNKLFLYIFF